MKFVLMKGFGRESAVLQRRSQRNCAPLFDREHGSSELQPKTCVLEAQTNYLMRLITLGGGRLLIPEHCAALKFSLRFFGHFLLLVNLT